MRATFVICAVLVATVTAQPMGVLVPPHNWRYTIGDPSCTKAHCSVHYNLDMGQCSCGMSQTVPRTIETCMPHCGNECHQCTLLYPATKTIACGRQACSPEDWAAQIIPCEVSQWSSWSECSKPCEDKFGPGLQYREISIIQHSRNTNPCPSALERYEERPCNNVTCAEGVACHANPYCAGAMETCQNVACRVVQHTLDGENGAKHSVDCTDDGYGSVTCVDPSTQKPVYDAHFLPYDKDHENCTTVTQWDTSGSKLAERDNKKRIKATHRNNCAGAWYRAAGLYHIETSHRSWDPADNQTSHNIAAWSNSAGVAPFPNHNATHNHRPKPHYGERDGAKHFCKIHYPFGLAAPECKCMCIGEEQAVETCNHDRTKCFLTASPGLQKEIDAQGSGFTGTADDSTKSQHFPNWGHGQTVKLSDSVQPMVVKHAQSLVEIKGHSDGIYNEIDLNAANFDRNA